MTPVNNLKKKLRKRPSFVDEDKQWQLETDKLLGWLLVILIVFSFLMAGFITYAAFRGPVNHNFNNGKYNSIKYARERLIDEVEEIDDVEDIPSLNRNFLLKEDITIEEVLERKRKLEDDYYDREEVFIEEEEEYIYEDVSRDFNNVEEDRVRQAENVYQESETLLKEAEKMLDEETKLLKQLSKKLENIALVTVDTHQEVAPVQEDVDEKVVSDDDKPQENLTQQVESTPKIKRTKHTNPLIPKKKFSKAKKVSSPTALDHPIDVTPKVEIEDVKKQLPAVEERVKRSRAGRGFSSRFRKNENDKNADSGPHRG